MKLCELREGHWQAAISEHEDGTFSLALVANGLRPRMKEGRKHFTILNLDKSVGLNFGHPDGLQLSPRLVVRFYARPKQTQLRQIHSRVIQKLTNARPRLPRKAGCDRGQAPSQVRGGSPK